MQLERDLAKFRDNNAKVLALAVQDQASAYATASDTNTSYPILADVDHRVANAYGVYNVLDDNIAAPAVFIINQSGQIVWSYVGRNINDRPSNETILANLPPSL